MDESDYDSLPMHQNNTADLNMSDNHLEHHANESHLNVSHYDQHPYLKLNNQYHAKRDPSHRFVVLFLGTSLCFLYDFICFQNVK